MVVDLVCPQEQETRLIHEPLPSPDPETGRCGMIDDSDTGVQPPACEGEKRSNWSSCYLLLSRHPRSPQPFAHPDLLWELNCDGFGAIADVGSGAYTLIAHNGHS